LGQDGPFPKGVVVIGTTLFLLLGFGVTVLPFLPALFELWKSQDGNPSEIPRNQAVDPRKDPDQVFWYHVYVMRLGSIEELGEALSRGVRENGPLSGPLYFEAGYRSREKVLSMTSVDADHSGQFLEVHARERLTLGVRSRVLWWASADHVTIGDRSELSGKISAKSELRLGVGTTFNLLDSPLIGFGEMPNRRPEDEAIFKKVTGHHVGTGSRRIHSGDLTLPSGCVIAGDLIVRGKLSVGEGARVHGSIKARGRVDIGKKAWVGGSVFSEREVVVGEGARIKGALSGERSVEIRGGAIIGSAESHTSVVSQVIRAESTSLVHGTVRAWRRGEVVSCLGFSDE
jgi:cytoskeletal protein CcmA (bactofilin family)